MREYVKRFVCTITICTLLICQVFYLPLEVEAATKKVTKITLSEKTKSMYVGQKSTIKVKSVSPKKASKAVTWKNPKKKNAHRKQKRKGY